jgi:hypothetical protein
MLRHIVGGMVCPWDEEDGGRWGANEKSWIGGHLLFLRDGVKQAY